MFARVNDWGKGTWLAVLVLSIWLAWPVGLAVFLFLVGTGRLQAWFDEVAAPGGLGAGIWSGVRSMAGSASRPANPWSAAPASSGNDAFDSYRKAQLERLEEEAREFKAFLERLRRARDKAEFDQFMAERRRPVPTPSSTPSNETGEAS